MHLFFEGQQWKEWIPLLLRCGSPKKNIHRQCCQWRFLWACLTIKELLTNLRGQSDIVSHTTNIWNKSLYTFERSFIWSTRLFTTPAYFASSCEWRRKSFITLTAGLRPTWSGSRRRWSCWAATGTRTTSWPSTLTQGADFINSLCL